MDFDPNPADNQGSLRTLIILILLHRSHRHGSSDLFSSDSLFLPDNNQADRGVRCHLLDFRLGSLRGMTAIAPSILIPSWKGDQD